MLRKLGDRIKRGYVPQVEPPGEPAARPVRSRRRSRRRARRIAIVAVVVLAALIGPGVWLSRAESEHLPPRVSVEEIDVGGLAVEDARDRIDAYVERLGERTIEVVWPDGSTTIRHRALGLEGEVETALERAAAARGPFSRLGARLGLADQATVPLTLGTETEAVDRVVARLARRIERKPKSARVVVDGTAVKIAPAVPGVEVDRARLRALLAGLPARVEVPTTSAEAPIDDAEAQAAADVATRLLAHPVTVVAANRRARLRPQAIRQALTITAAGDELVVELHPEVLAALLERRFAPLEREPRDARFVLTDAGIEIRPHRLGRAVDVEALARDLVAQAGARRVEARLRRVAPSITTTFAETMGISEQVSEFTTPYACCPSRVTNIRRGARILNGIVIKPGARFSLNEALGERTRAAGFVQAPMILRGRLVDAVGGGVSQIATTMFNAAFFAGLDLIEHMPHEFYISRYPMGREATVSWPGPDLVFRNNWPAGILIEAVARDTSITIRFWSSKLGRRVATKTGQPYDFRPAATFEVLNQGLSPGARVVVQSGGIEGFSVRYTRRVFRGGKLVKNERFTTRYNPENTIVEVGPPRPVRRPGAGRTRDGAAT